MDCRSGPSRSDAPGDPGIAFAVRSSAISEDSAGAYSEAQRRTAWQGQRLSLMRSPTQVTSRLRSVAADIRRMGCLPNNSLNLTRRAGPSGPLESPAGLANSHGVSARFGRAAWLEAFRRVKMER